MTALVQKASRARSWALDKSTLYTKVTRHVSPDEVVEALTYGSYMVGLYLEGAAWDHGSCMLKRQEPKILVVDLPVIEVIPIETSKLRLAGTFRTPVYVTQSRRAANGVGMAFVSPGPIAPNATLAPPPIRAVYSPPPPPLHPTHPPRKRIWRRTSTLRSGYSRVSH